MLLTSVYRFKTSELLIFWTLVPNNKKSPVSSHAKLNILSSRNSLCTGNIDMRGISDVNLNRLQNETMVILRLIEESLIHILGLGNKQKLS